MSVTTHPVYIDGLAGPTYTFLGLGIGNTASLAHKGEPSNPQKTALQGLYKMKQLADLGIKQALLPPQERPDIATLRLLGFMGTDAEVLARAAKEAPELLWACSASSALWTANGATISPSSSTADGRVHITPANLATLFHRSLEPIHTALALQCLLPFPESFVHHDPLPSHHTLGDEGAANTLTLCASYDGPQITLFVYGKEGRAFSTARQSLEASQSIARLHRLSHTLFAKQSPPLVERGVFHNDLVATAHKNTLLYYQDAWVDTPKLLAQLSDQLEGLGTPLTALEITQKELPLEDLLDSYLLNSQLLPLPSGELLLAASTKARDNPRSKAVIDRLLAESNPIKQVLYFDLSESLKNGGGPACVTLPCLLTESELGDSHDSLFMNDTGYAALVDWVKAHYRDRLTRDDLGDPALLLETRQALDDLTVLLDLGPIYPFQMG
ncbi:MAG: N-succinylarginine dihydrolase [Parachlamydiales bacterium]